MAATTAVLMSEISERVMCAGWESGLEYTLWDLLQGQPVWSRWNDVTSEERQMLRELSQALGGWVILDHDNGNQDRDSLMYAHRFVTLAEWRRMYTEHTVREQARVSRHQLGTG